MTSTLAGIPISWRFLHPLKTESSIVLIQDPKIGPNTLCRSPQHWPELRSLSALKDSAKLPDTRTRRKSNTFYKPNEYLAHASVNRQAPTKAREPIVLRHVPASTLDHLMHPSTIVAETKAAVTHVFNTSWNHKFFHGGASECS